MRGYDRKRGYADDRRYELVEDPELDVYGDEPEDDLDEGLDEEELPDLRSRLVAVLSTSYGASIGLHIVLLLILGAILIAVPTKRIEAKVIGRQQPYVEPPVDKLAPLDIKKKPELKLPKQEVVVRPIDPIEPDVVIPKGDPTKFTNREQKSNTLNPDYGIGGGRTGAYGFRNGEGRATGGGSEKSEEAKKAALRWLADHQSPDGSWDPYGWESQCDGNVCAAREAARTAHLIEKGPPQYRVGVTALALLAFLGDGQTQRYGEHRVVINRALKFLKSQQRPDGSIGFEHGETIYNHAIATMALCEAHAMTKDIRFARTARKAVEFAVIAQNPGQGWRYGIKAGRNDSSVTAWFVLALKAARTAEIEVPEEAFAGARAWFDRATSVEGRTGYQTPGGGSSYVPARKGLYDEVPTNTASALVCRIFTGQRKQEDVIQKAQRILLASPPSWPSASDSRGCNFYYWYYGTYAMFQIGGRPFREWNEAMLKALLPNQRTGEGCERGSWDPVGEWCIGGGRVYATAINALTLEVYYRYQRMLTGQVGQAKATQR